MKKGLGSLIGIAVIFGAINLCLYIAQHVGETDDRERLDQIESTLTKMASDIGNMESRFNALDERLTQCDSRLDQLESYIVSMEDRYPTGIPSLYYQSYSDAVDEYNAMIGPCNDALAEMDLLYDEYSAQVDSYNVLVAEGQVIAQRIGTTWYIIPIPRIFR